MTKLPVGKTPSGPVNVCSTVNVCACNDDISVNPSKQIIAFESTAHNFLLTNRPSDICRDGIQNLLHQLPANGYFTRDRSSACPVVARVERPRFCLSGR